MYKSCALTYSGMWISARKDKTRVYSTKAAFLGTLLKDLLSFANKNFGREVSHKELVAAAMTGNAIEGTSWRVRIDYVGLWSVTRSWFSTALGHQWSETSVFSTREKALEDVDVLINHVNSCYVKIHESLNEIWYHNKKHGHLVKMGHALIY